MKKIKAKRIESNDYSYEAFFFNLSIEPGKTIMISSLQDGWYTLCNVISHKMKFEYYLLTLSATDEPEPMNALFYVNNLSEKKRMRVVYVMKEGRWLFYSEGTPLSFEKTDYYKRVRKKERLNKDILPDSCRKAPRFSHGDIRLSSF